MFISHSIMNRTECVELITYFIQNQLYIMLLEITR